MRLYEMFMGPLEVSKPWSTRGIAGVKRFLDRVWRIAQRAPADGEPSTPLLRLLHKTIRKVGQDTGRLEFNTAIAQMMIFMNEAAGLASMPRALWQPFLLLLSPYAPHLAEELWAKLGGTASVCLQPWPAWDESLAAEQSVEVVFQINGKIRAKEDLPAGLSEADTREKARANPRMRELLEGKEIRKIIVVPGKLVNVVAAL